MTYCTRKHNRHSIGQHKRIKVRSLGHYSKETYDNILQEVKWDLIYTNTDVNDAWSTFHTIITEVMDEVAPEKEIRIKTGHIRR